jgi:predicted ribonuclease YlaK
LNLGQQKKNDLLILDLALDLEEDRERQKGVIISIPKNITKRLDANIKQIYSVNKNTIFFIYNYQNYTRFSALDNGSGLQDLQIIKMQQKIIPIITQIIKAATTPNNTNPPSSDILDATYNVVQFLSPNPVHI